MLPGHPAHNLILLLGRVGRLPSWVLLSACVLAAWGAAQLYGDWLVAFAILAGAVVTDALLLWSLPRLGVSFGPVQGPLAIFAGGRLVLALPLALVPGGSALWALAAGQALLTGCSHWGHLVAPFRVEVNRVRLPLLRRAPARPVRLLFFSDLHMERWTRRERRVLEHIDALEPDLVLFGGDLLNLSFVEDPQAVEHAREFMRHLRSRHRLRVVLGNPTVEVRSVVCPFWESLGVTPLDAHSEGFAFHGATLRLYGLPTTLSLTADRDRLRALLAAEPPGPAETTVLLYHLPDLAGSVEGLDVQLSGHTHGGQIRLPLVGPLFTASNAPRRHAQGTHRVGDTVLHTGRGVGMEGAGAPRMRFFCRPEITLVELTGSSSAA